MCAINGITKNDRELVLRMNATTAYRGPDGTGVYHDDFVTLGHNRLAIIDTSENGAQPMCSRDNSVVLVYNGELYNYRELKQQLKGYQFKSNSDTEVILAAYDAWGIESLKKCNGIFAFALWDKKTKTLLLARDPLGIKPLYYHHHGSELSFASEAKSLFEVNDRRKIHSEALSHYFRLTDAYGAQTLFKGIHQLPPAHYATFKDGALTLQRYWQRTLTDHEDHSAHEWQERVRSTFDNAVQRQLVSDRPIGVFLSGGIDSSSVLASAVRHGGSMNTYTTRFALENGNDEKYNHDAELARKTADFFGCNHTEVMVESKNIIPLFEEVVWHMDSPTSCTAAISQLALSQQASKEVTVVLGGDGGDELFGGYTRYQHAYAMHLYQHLPTLLTKQLGRHATLRKLATPPGIEQLHLFYCMKQQTLEKILQPHFRANHTDVFLTSLLMPEPEIDTLDQLMNVDLQLLSDGSLLRMDKLTMAAGLEGRVPLLDLELVELSAKIPSAYKVDLLNTKKVLKAAMKEQLPEYLFHEKKRGWVAPSGKWLREPTFQEYAKVVLSPSYYQGTQELFKWDHIAEMFDAHCSGEKSSRILIWTLLAFQVWARRFQAAV